MADRLQVKITPKTVWDNVTNSDVEEVSFQVVETCDWWKNYFCTEGFPDLCSHFTETYFFYQ